MIWHQKPLFDSQKYKIPLFRPRFYPITIRQGVSKQQLGPDHISPRRRATELLEPSPMPHVVMLGRTEAGSSDEAVFWPDDFSGEEGGEMRMRFGQV